ncbi:MAG: LptE family protein [Rhodothermales bacterium]
MKKYFAFCLFAFYLLPGCAYYSFTGASIPDNLNTIAIPLVVDNSQNTIPELSDQLTEALVDRFVNQTRLSLVENEDDADALLTVEIQRYNNAPSSVSGDEIAALNRVTITVMVLYEDQADEKELLKRTFSNFEDYDPLDISNETVAALAALQNVADDIFTAATSNW